MRCLLLAFVSAPLFHAEPLAGQAQWPIPSNDPVWDVNTRVDVDRATVASWRNYIRQNWRPYHTSVCTDRSPDHPEWIEYLMYAAKSWESAKAEYGANSDEALVVRDELARLRRLAVWWSELPRARESLAEVVDLVEGILLAGGAVK